MLLNCVGEDSRVPWSARRSNESILKEISPGCSLEGLTLKLKVQYLGHLMQRVDSLEKTLAGKDWSQEEKGMTEDEMVGWHYLLLDGHEFEQTPGDDKGQGSLACCSPWGCKESDTAERLTWTEAKMCIWMRKGNNKEEKSMTLKSENQFFLKITQPKSWFFENFSTIDKVLVQII